MSVAATTLPTLLEAAGLMGLGVSLLIFEFVVFSWGVLTALAAICALGACLVAWSISPLVGIIFIIACLLLGISAARWARHYARKTPLVNQADLTADAGYHHLAHSLGVEVGSQGVLVTDALPTGRARFSLGEIDVRAEGAPLARGTKVVVLRIEGPSLTVAAVP